MTRNEELDTLVEALWESDEASALTNQAARMIEKLRAELRRAKEQAIEDSWIRNPDRMGGQFTEEEINRGAGQFGKWHQGR